MLYDNTNQLFTIASDFIHYSNLPIFLTGKAGSGKTTFLKYIKEHTAKKTAITAPTGVAAINAGGVTLHSFFQLPFGSFVPNYPANRQHANVIDRHHLLGRIRMNNERRGILQELELLIIDEISMVRCDVLDAVDGVLRHFRNRQREPFGGVQVLLIGDMFQLPPVTKDDEWNVLSAFYETPYFFSSHVIQEQQPVCIEFDKIYRQNELHFIDLLNKLRDNRMDTDGYELLQSRLQPAFEPGKDDEAIILTTHNYKADAINAQQLAKLNTDVIVYKAKIEKDFSEKSFPAEEILQLKTGAQVMFIKNDADKNKRYFNGKIGRIEKLEDETIFIQCKDEEAQIELHRETWENIRYTLNSSSKKLEEEVIGTFTQFPLRLAWAITIHKSQGLTFEKAVIDAAAAFAPGQVYVALSRCTTLNGIILKSAISNSGLQNDERIVKFSAQKKPFAHLQNKLTEGKKEYQKNILLSLFYFDELSKKIESLVKTVDEHASSFNAETQPWLILLQKKINAAAEIAKKFQSQLQKILSENEILPENNLQLQERIKAAAVYFTSLLENIFTEIPHSPAHTDSKQNSLAYDEDLKELYLVTAKKMNALSGCKENFSIDKYHLQKNQFSIKPLLANSFSGNKTYQTDLPHPLLLKGLRILRDEICEEMNMPLYMVAGTTTLSDMVRYLPQTENELMQISGFGKVKAEKFGKRFLEVIIKYAEDNFLQSSIHEKEIKRKRKEKTEIKTDTKEETYKLYKAGKTVKEIGEERKLAPQTIEGHLAFYVQNGLISIDELVTKEKLILIEPLVKNYEGNSITPVKEKLGNEISYGEIRLTIAWLAFQKTISTSAD